MKQEINLPRLEKALQTAAMVVKLHGPQYLPICLRLENEIRQMKSKQTDLDRILAMTDHAA